MKLRLKLDTDLKATAREISSILCSVRYKSSLYMAKADRYKEMRYNRCCKSGLKLLFLSLSLWHNFGDNAREMLLGAFDLGITHFDIVNNYGPPAGSAESNFGRVLREDFAAYRDKLVISTKAGYSMWPGPYGEWGSKKNLLSSTTLHGSLSFLRGGEVNGFIVALRANA